MSVEVSVCLAGGELGAVFTYVFGKRYSKNTFETVKYHRLLSDSTGRLAALGKQVPENFKHST